MAENKIPDHVKAQAVEAAAKTKEMQTALPANVKEASAPQPAQREGAQRAQEKIVEMAKSGKDGAEITKAASKDDFGKH